MLEYLSIALTSFMSIEVIIALIVGVVGGYGYRNYPGSRAVRWCCPSAPDLLSMSPTAALVMMTAMYTTGVYGGSITAVLCQALLVRQLCRTTMDVM